MHMTDPSIKGGGQERRVVIVGGQRIIEGATELLFNVGQMIRHAPRQTAFLYHQFNAHNQMRILSESQVNLAPALCRRQQLLHRAAHLLAQRFIQVKTAVYDHNRCAVSK